MRPMPGDDAFGGRSRSGSVADNDLTPLVTRSQQPQMTYFFADEKSIEESDSNVSLSPASCFPKQRDPNTPKGSMYGVESLETTTSSLQIDDQEDEQRIQKARHSRKNNIGLSSSRPSEEDLSDAASAYPSWKSSADISRNVSPSHQRRPSQTGISRPITPLSYGSPAPASVMSSPGSRRNSDAGSYMDDIASQAIISSGDEEREINPQLMDSGSAPQLVMPSIKMPSRRPFTESGKSMGRLKVLIAGDSSVGKTSLIKAIVQTCEDIVHVDPLSPTAISIPETRRRSSRSSRKGSSNMQTTSQITEVYASTKPYPAWWSDLEDSRILQRRKSLGDSVLERNLCFVDTPGYGNKTSCLECITPVIDYMESHLRKATSPENISESDMISMLSGNGGSQVDLVLYVILHRIKPVDIEYLRRLSHLTNVIPLVAQAEHLSQDELLSIKEHIRGSLQEANIHPFHFASVPKGAHSHPESPYAISTTASKDHENMDASLLMSPDYVSPLIPSELSILVSQIFDPSNISWLRHSAAKKFIQWRDFSTPSQSIYQPIGASSSPISTAPVGATTSYALARITDHAQREERIAQVRLANWAADLQRSLQNERARFDQLARSERAVWLTERLGECVQDGSIIPISQARKQDDGYSCSLIKQGSYSRRKEWSIGPQRDIDVHDPLGLLQLNVEMKKRGWVAVKFLGGFGILGGLAFWLVRTWQGTNIWGVPGKDWAELGMADWR
ncbi:p-loop containing nucleoside triphosphate hydrolase [Venustampulla echinocandica]|uniref:p-loop containing nucleoside triphosphate hydrolase n=1 Tax=Venustampulla echinocandica TaxID=2656787 RepID=A0A370TZ16_9HELO|nr:p-loop containing nucleoside triphosphate hydrolase [Venustampulla echinocandica]RDL40779.1 p-loop containing nucleoside triphosphate hydrolase [Venustampulla echinocandica]